MKKVIFSALVFALVLGAFQTSWSAGRTSASLSLDGALISNIDDPSNDTLPVGSVMFIHNKFWLASSPEFHKKWLSCTGKVIPAGSEYDKARALLGGKTPDYRGRILTESNNGTQGHRPHAEFYVYMHGNGATQHIDGLSSISFHTPAEPTGEGSYESHPMKPYGPSTYTSVDGGSHKDASGTVSATIPLGHFQEGYYYIKVAD